jgi:glycosyl transferase family 2
MAGDAYEAEHDQQRAARDERIRGERREDVAGWGAKSKYIRSLPTGTLSFVGVNQVAGYRADTTGAGLVPRTAIFSPANADCDDDYHHGALSWAPVGLSFFTFWGSTEEEIDADALRDADWPYYTILCPLYREARIVPQFAHAMTAQDYPVEKLQILFLTEADDAETRNAIRALSLPSHFKIVSVPEGSPRTKPRACNFGLMQAFGQYVVIYDAEDIPEPTQLKYCSIPHWWYH